MGIQCWERRDGEGAEIVPEAEATFRQAVEPDSAVVEAQGPAAEAPPPEPVKRVVQDDVPVEQLDWEALASRVAGCTACELHRSRTQTVFGVGDRRADWLVIGEAPGAEEDRQGEPFVGRAGQLLNNMLLAIGLKREQVYIANILKCRPPKNRDPRPEEVVCCEPYLARQVALLQPKIILAVGRIAAQNLLKTDTSLARMRGRVFNYGESQVPVVVTYHPAYLLRTPRDKRKTWEDLQFATRVYNEVREAGA
ncbi:MAG TPA: uracil-DNA glycosylase [Gammaproteobacteria bacterium]|nr:uracil-DNA glycosylase [Gammaproteobacteria bacterium]